MNEEASQSSSGFGQELEHAGELLEGDDVEMAVEEGVKDVKILYEVRDGEEVIEEEADDDEKDDPDCVEHEEEDEEVEVVPKKKKEADEEMVHEEELEVVPKKNGVKGRGSLMKAIVCTKYGPPEVLQLKEVEKPTPKANELLIKVFATTVTFGDMRIRSFTWPLWFRLPGRLMYGITGPRSDIPGNELAGLVESVGNDVTRFKKGDHVFGIAWGTSFQGATAEYKCLPEDGMVATMPAGMTHEEASALPVGGLSALHFLRKADIRVGQKVLVYGASGSVGTFAVQLAKHFGAEVTAVCSTSNLEMVKNLGAENVIDYTKEEFAESGQIYDVIFDAVGKTSFSHCKRSLKEEGFFLTTDWPFMQALWTSLVGTRKVVIGIARENPEDLCLLKELVEAGRIRSVIDRCYPLEQTAEAHRYVEKGHKRGNVVITLCRNNPAPSAQSSSQGMSEEAGGPA